VRHAEEAIGFLAEVDRLFDDSGKPWARGVFP
jgi:hypothetical protein